MRAMAVNQTVNARSAEAVRAMASANTISIKKGKVKADSLEMAAERANRAAADMDAVNAIEALSA